ncbi:MAG: two component transcriptional regulator, LytTR family [Anaerocolumna sp.]|jgi:DNA-binding LytR/AlgR family response regulator|nr:two component transcriptional regulator, LytTR family [Anaerocolumna sp.]
MRIAYCDDEKVQYVYLKELIDKWEIKQEKKCEISVYQSAEEMLFENQGTFSFDFILLDIELDKMNGVELARNIRQADKNVTIAFLSNSKEYVFEGYEVGAVRYLLKPLTETQLFPLLDRVQSLLKEEADYIIIGVDREKIKLNTEDINYVEALGHYVRIHTTDQVYEVKINMNEMEKQLTKGFVPTHRSYLVNLNCIEKITRTACIINTKETVPISRNSYNAVNEAFIRFYKGGLN